MNNFVKIYGSIIRSTVWQTAPHIKLTWVTMLILADADGRVEASIPGLASTAGVTIEQCEEALACFLAPDKYSRTKDHQGRRIEEITGGWVVLNHSIYRDMRSPKQQKEAERQDRYRRRKAEGKVTPERRSKRAAARDETPHDDGPRDDRDTSDNGRDVSREHHENRHLSRLSRVDPDPDPDPDLEPIPSIRGGSTRAGSPPSPMGEVVTRPVGARQHFAPEDFEPLERHVARAAEFKLDLARELTAFREHEFDRAYSDWPRAFDRWLTKAKTIAETERFQATQRRGSAPGPRSAFQHQPDEGVTGWESTDEEPAAVG